MDSRILSHLLTRRQFLGTTTASAAIVAASDRLLTGPMSTLMEGAITSAEAETKAIPTYCGFCGNRCGVTAHVGDGRLLWVEGKTTDPTSEGTLCAKGNSAVQSVYSPYRLKYPLKRVGERGEGKWQRITWDEALSTIAEKLNSIKDESGPESVIISGGSASGSPCGEWYNWPIRLSYAFGSPNFLSMSAHVCGSFPADIWSNVYGWIPAPDYDKTQCIVAWGQSVVNSGAGFGLTRIVRQVLDAKQRGAKLIVVDPFLTPLAAKADIWAPVRPGTDGALALGMMNVIINENLYDRDFMTNWTIGFDQLKQYVQDFSPDKVAEITWVPKEKIIEIARTYGTVKPACVDFGIGGLAAHSNATQSARAVSILPALTGNIDIAGGNVLTMPLGYFLSNQLSNYGKVADTKLVTPEAWGKKLPWHLLYKNFTPPTFYKACLTGDPYPIKALLLFAGGGFIVDGDSAYGRKAMLNVDFLVASDIVMSPYAEICDIVLPAANSYETEYALTWGPPPYVKIRQPVVNPPGECRGDLDVIFDLAVRLGVGDAFWGGDLEKGLNWMLEPTGVTMDDLRQSPDGQIFLDIPSKIEYKSYEQKGFKTPSGKVEIGSSILKEAGYAPLPVYAEPPEGPISQPELAKKYPLVLNTGRYSPLWCHNQMRDRAWLREIEKYPTVMINPRKAGELGIADGEWVIVESPRGSIKVRALYFEGVNPDVVGVPYGWWQGCEELGLQGYGWNGAHSNVLTSLEPQEPIHGCTNHLSLLCNIKKA